jgi:hypothetical protein
VLAFDEKPDLKSSVACAPASAAVEAEVRSRITPP